MSKRTSSSRSSGSSRKKESATIADNEEEFVLVPPTNEDGTGETRKIDTSPEGLAAEEEYQRKLDIAYKAELLGVDLPPVAPPGHHLQPVIEKPKITFWTLLFRKAENRSALYQLYITTALMAIVPLSMMGISYYTIFSGLEEESRLTWSGFAGVLGVNIIAVGFGIFAYYDQGGDDDEDQEEVDSAAEIEAKRKKWTQWELEQEAEASREDRERLEAIRVAHAAKQDGVEPGTVKAEASSSSSTSSSKKRSLRKTSDEHDAPVEDDTASPAEETDAPAPSRTTRARSRKA